MTDLDLWGPRVAWPNHFDAGEILVVPPFAFAKSRTHCIAIELDSKTVTGSVELDDLDPVLSLAADCHSEGGGDGGGVVFLTAHRSSLIRVYHGAALEQVLVFKSNHNGPVISMHCSVTERRLLTVGVAKDICLKVWDIEANTCLKSVRPLAARPTAMALAKEGGLVCLGNVEGQIQVYEAAADYKAAVLTKHVSPVATLRALGDLLVSAGRDEILVLWDLKGLAALKVIPTFESVECVVFFAADGSRSFLTGGSKGKLRLWDSKSGKELDSSRFAEWSLDGAAIDSLEVDKDGGVHFVQEDVLFSRPGNSVMSLNRNEINDIALVRETFLVVAGNSSILKVYHAPLALKTDAEGSAASGRQELSAFQTDHEDAIVHLSSWGDTNKFISAGKENRINVWRLKGGSDLKLLHTCAGHSAKITAIKMVGSVVSSSDEHGILKVWLVPEKRTAKEDTKLAALKTVIAHQKEVCCLDACADKQLLASGSLDKTAKIYNLQTLEQVGVVSGHRRGVSAIRISPHERIMATGCQDSTIKLWELNGFTCFKTLEGQQSHVLSLTFSALNVLHSTGNDGVHYVWNIHASAPKVGAFEGHDGQIWSALSRGPDEVITAGTDGKIVFWRNNADAIAARREEENRLKVQDDQTLQNCILKGKTRKALKLALKMDRPKVAHNLLIAAHEAGNLTELLDAVEEKLAPKLMDYVLQWNANSRYYVVAQFVQRHYLSKRLDVQAFGCSMDKALKLMAYNEKHAARLAKLNSRFAIVDLLLQD